MGVLDTSHRPMSLVSTDSSLCLSPPHLPSNDLQLAVLSELFGIGSDVSLICHSCALRRSHQYLSDMFLPVLFFQGSTWPVWHLVGEGHYYS